MHALLVVRGFRGSVGGPGDCKFKAPSGHHQNNFEIPIHCVGI